MVESHKKSCAGNLFFLLAHVAMILYGNACKYRILCIEEIMAEIISSIEIYVVTVFVGQYCVALVWVSYTSSQRDACSRCASL